jgi:NADP-dependent 3-hydroxy acid dehydrogenase YdfG
MPTDTTNIIGKVVVITGASRGLGAAAARFLAGCGATVVLGARRLERLQALAGEIVRSGDRASAIVTDVTDAAQVQALVDAAVERYGRIYEQYAISADSFARAVAFAINQPEDVDINEILFRPTRQEL